MIKLLQFNPYGHLRLRSEAMKLRSNYQSFEDSLNGGLQSDDELLDGPVEHQPRRSPPNKRNPVLLPNIEAENEEEVGESKDDEKNSPHCPHTIPLPLPGALSVSPSFSQSPLAPLFYL